MPRVASDSVPPLGREPRLAGRVAIVTGAASGVGRACAGLFAAEGAGVLVTDVDIEGAKAVAEEIQDVGGRAAAAHLDVRSPEEAEHAVAQSIREFGHLDILVNSAGGSARVIGRLSTFVDSSPDVWDWVMGVNLLGPMICAHAAAGQMVQRGHGRILNLGSVAGVVGLERMVDYSAAKGGVIALTRALAMELAPFGVTVNCVSPGMIASRPGGNPEGTYLGRMGSPDEVARLLLHLASDDGAFITGENIVIDGGRVLGPKLGTGR